ncbi:MAG: hypothetical protein ACOYXB_11400 [Bacteroidota bacterium]
MKRYSSILPIISLIISIFICEPIQAQINDNSSISKIVIQIFPAFYTHSQIIFDVNKSDMVFDMIGDVRFIKEDANFDMKPFYYKFNSEESKYLNDSILSSFLSEDFSNSFRGVTDGIGIDILYSFNDGNSKKIELSNSSTLNQSKLITYLLNTLISNCSDSMTVKYSKIIDKYY